MQPNGTPQYRTYLLRCWEECAANGAEKFWRFSLEDTRTGQRRGYSSLSELNAALEADMAGERKTGPPD